jgi:hypothetical protein
MDRYNRQSTVTMSAYCPVCRVKMVCIQADTAKDCYFMVDNGTNEARVVVSKVLCCSDGCLAVYQRAIKDRITAWAKTQGYAVTSQASQASIDWLVGVGILAKGME